MSVRPLTLLVLSGLAALLLSACTDFSAAPPTLAPAAAPTAAPSDPPTETPAAASTEAPPTPSPGAAPASTPLASATRPPSAVAATATAAPPGATPTQEASVPEPSPSPDSSIDPALRQAQPVQQALADLADRLSVEQSAIVLERVEEVIWPDGSLGCPQPDMAYRQVLVDGVFIQLRVGDNVYRYHGGGGRAPALCLSKDEVLPEDLPTNPYGSNEDV